MIKLPKRSASISVLNSLYLVCFDSYGKLKLYKPEIEGEEYASSCLYKRKINHIELFNELPPDDILILHNEHLRKEISKIYNSHLTAEEQKLTSAINTQIFTTTGFANQNSDAIYESLTIIQLIDLQCNEDDINLDIDEIFKRFKEQNPFKIALDNYLENKYKKN